MRGREQELTEPAVLFEGLGLEPGQAAVVGSVVEGSPAERAGPQAGDRVIRGNGEPIEDWEQWVEFLQSRPGETVELTVLRGDRELALTATLDTHHGERQDVRPHRRQWAPPFTEQRYGILESLPRAVDEDLGDDHVHRVDARAHDRRATCR